MPLYENFPYTNFHELNLDWLVEKVASLEAAFPEGTIGIVKGGTGATTAEGARENLGIIAPNIPMAEGSSSTLDQELSRLEDNINSLSGDIKYRIFRLVTDLGQSSGTATLASCWAAMSIGDILIAPPSEFAPGQVPENSGSLVLVRNAGTSGSLRFYGNRTYEQEFQNNYPTGIWHTILNDTDIIPVSKGGTGAATAAEARQNLGIDFSGTVLSVAGVGADTAGNVPLTAADLKVKMKLYTSITDPDIGLPTGSSVTAVWNALPANSRVVFPRSEVFDPPVDAAGVIDIAKTGPNSNLGWILYYGQQGSTGNYQMYLTSAGVPSGTWKKVGVDYPSNNSIKFSNGIIIAWGEITVQVSTQSGGPFAYRGYGQVNVSSCGMSSIICAFASVLQSAGFWNGTVSTINGTAMDITAAGDKSQSAKVYWLAIGT